MTKTRGLSRRELLVGSGAVLASAALAAPAIAQKVKLPWLEWVTLEISEPKTQGLLNAFYQTSAGKSIEIVRQPVPFGQALDKILTLHLAGQAPDVLLLAPAWVPGLADQGVLEPLNPFLEKAGKDWTGTLVQAVTPPWKGSFYTVPLTATPCHLYYNEGKLADAGFSAPPKTWAEVESMGPKLTNPAKNTYCYASGMAAKSPYDGPEKEILPLIYQGNDMVIKNGKCNLNAPAAVKAVKTWLKWVYDLKIYAPGALTNMGKDKNEAFIGEQVAMVNNHPAHITIIEQRNPKLKFGVAPLPENETFGTTAGGWVLGMSRGSKNKEAAWEFLYWLVGPEGSAKVTLAAKHLPGNTKADVAELYQIEPRLKISAAIMARGRVYIEAAALPEGVNLYRILAEQIHEAANKRKTVEQALDFATAEWNKVIAKHA
jgi:multiple sugar transport system substrate-binding protein